MLIKRKTGRRDMADVNVYTASRLGEMAHSLEILARSCQEEGNNERGLSREDALAAMQMSAAMVCEGCNRCNLYSDSEKEDSYYLYYLLRTVFRYRLYQKMYMVFICTYFYESYLITFLYLHACFFYHIIHFFIYYYSTVFCRTHKMIHQH